MPGLPRGRFGYLDIRHLEKEPGSAPAEALCTITHASDGNSSPFLNAAANNTGTSLTVNPLAVSLTGSRNYDGTMSASASALTIANNLDGANLTLSGSATLASANVASQTLSSFGGLTLGGSAAGNYTLTGARGSVTINQRPITVTAQPNTKLYDGTTSAMSVPAIASGNDTTGVINSACTSPTVVGGIDPDNQHEHRWHERRLAVQRPERDERAAILPLVTTVNDQLKG